MERIGADQRRIIAGLQCHAGCEQGYGCNACPYLGIAGDCSERLAKDALALLGEREVMTPEAFRGELMKMFSSIWDCEIDHPLFQDTVGELMEGVTQAYKKAVRLE